MSSPNVTRAEYGISNCTNCHEQSCVDRAETKREVPRIRIVHHRITNSASLDPKYGSKKALVLSMKTWGGAGCGDVFDCDDSQDVVVIFIMDHLLPTFVRDKFKVGFDIVSSM
jgi:hypothetical protein